MLAYFVLVILVIVLDQASKWIIVHKLDLYETRSVIGDFFSITSHRNTGAAFSILEGQRWFFLTITLVVVVAIVWYIRRTIRDRRRLLSTALALLLGGAIGNFADRALFGEVVDFLQLRFQFDWFGKAIDYTYPIFNLADSAIDIGVALIFLDSLLDWRKEKRRKQYETQQQAQQHNEE